MVLQGKLNFDILNYKHFNYKSHGKGTISIE